MEASVLAPEGVGMTQFLPSPTHRSPRCPEYHTWSQKGGWPAVLSAYTKDNGPFQHQIWPRGLGRSCPRSPPLSWGCLPSRLAGFRLNSARRRLWASVLRNWGMPSFALKQPPGLIRAEPHPRGPISLPLLSRSSFQLMPDKPSSSSPPREFWDSPPTGPGGRTRGSGKHNASPRGVCL